MIKMDIRHDINKAASQMVKLAKDMRDVAIMRAINKTATQAKTQAGREIKDQYQISTRVIGKSITIRRAARGALDAVITAEGKPLPLIAFQARQSRGGVSVQIKGRRVTIPHSFIATMKSGHRGVYARGGYKGSFERNGQSFGRFQFGKQRFPIGELFTFSVPQGFSNKVVQRKVIARVNEQFPKVLAQEITYLMSRK
jgi:hypothetical protein